MSASQQREVELHISLPGERVTCWKGSVYNFFAVRA